MYMSEGKEGTRGGLHSVLMKAQVPRGKGRSEDWRLEAGWGRG
jgi:hypothetical protein